LRSMSRCTHGHIALLKECGIASYILRYKHVTPNGVPASLIFINPTIYICDMKAIQVSQTGGPEVLTLVDVPVPTIKPNEALVELKASGVNFIDVYFREG